MASESLKIGGIAAVVLGIILAIIGLWVGISKKKGWGWALGVVGVLMLVIGGYLWYENRDAKSTATTPSS